MSALIGEQCGSQQPGEDKPEEQFAAGSSKGAQKQHEYKLRLPCTDLK